MYQSFDDDIIDSFYKPALLVAKNYKRITGFFSATFLDNLAKEIQMADELNDLYIQIVCSPEMSEQDKKNIELGYDIRQIIFNNIDETIDRISEDSETLPLISSLIARKKLDVKFVITKNKLGMFHAKTGIVSDLYGDKLAFSGSNNETNNAVFNNYESFVVLTGWENPRHVMEIESSFDKIWNNQVDSLTVIDINYELEEIINKKQTKTKEGKSTPYSAIDIETQYDLHPYQEEAITKWMENGHKGLLEMATGTGKTVTALACYSRLIKSINKLVAIIVVPQNELLYQWDEDIQKAGGESILCYSGNRDWETLLKSRLRRLSIENEEYKGYINVIVTRDTFVSEKFLNLVSASKLAFFIIADEVHSFGSETVRKNFKKIENFFDYRLGISATPFRKVEYETKKLIEFFNGIVFSYTLKEAIDSGYLNDYIYKPKILFFDVESLGEFKHFYFMNKEKILTKDATVISEIERLTSTIANSSTVKVNQLMEDFQMKLPGYQSIVYCSAGGYNDTMAKYEERHIDYVSKALSKIAGVKLRKVRSQVQPLERQEIIKQFKNSSLNVLVAIKCLDQGINLPNVTDAYILSSTDSDTEFIQRRGRILRTYPGKPTSNIYDYVMLPQDYKNSFFVPDEADGFLVARELRRMNAYCSGSKNEEEVREIIEEITFNYQNVLESE